MSKKPIKPKVRDRIFAYFPSSMVERALQDGWVYDVYQMKPPSKLVEYFVLMEWPAERVRK